MLPSPVSSNQRRTSNHTRLRSFSSSDLKRALSLLRARSRFTNLGILLLAVFGCISFLYNLAFIFTSSPSSYLLNYTPPPSILATIARNSTLESLSHLVIVPGHAIWVGAQLDHVLDEDWWVLEEYQRGGGRVAAFVEHIRRGVEIMLKDDASLLVFSGGQTRLQSTTTEAESYMRLASSLGLFYPGERVYHAPYSPRATTEAYALDSYQNLLFSLARFHEITGRYPIKVSIVGYEMKRRRFEELHRAALRFPATNFEYIGIEPPASEEERVSARIGELNNGYMPYEIDLYGCHGFLLAKRRARNPFLRFHSYHTSAPELRGLLEWCPDDATMAYNGPLPWDVYE